MSEFVEVTMLVPVKDIKITNSTVEKEIEGRHTPADWLVDVWDIEVSGLDYEIVGFDDVSEPLLNKAIEEWREL
ncbi:hypothetical protein [Pseudoalteromonas marina]|uniref:hypothetical protein n=1 Tax=Pseudoalteromonas marina TaxID=267375 RepID=UPI003C6A7EA5